MGGVSTHCLISSYVLTKPLKPNEAAFGTPPHFITMSFTLNDIVNIFCNVGLIPLDSCSIPAGICQNPPDSTGFWWTPVDSGGFLWIPVDSSGFQQIPAGMGGAL